jgi:hypothetical protein
MSKNYLTMCVLACIASSSAYARVMNNGACPSELSANSACVQLENLGEVDISMQAMTPFEDGTRTANSGKQAFYQFRTLRATSKVILLPNFTDALMDETCSLFDWGNQLAQGQKVVISDLTPAQYHYSFGYKHVSGTDKYMMVNCKQ